MTPNVPTAAETSVKMLWISLMDVACDEKIYAEHQIAAARSDTQTRIVPHQSLSFMMF